MAKGILDRVKQRHRLFVLADKLQKEGKTLREIAMSTGVSKNELIRVLEKSGYKTTS